MEEKTNLQETVFEENALTTEANKEEHIISFASNISKMEPDVIKKAMEQTPEIAKTARDAIGSMKEVTTAGLRANETSTERTFDILDKNADAIRKCMTDGNLSEDGQLKMADKLCETSKAAVNLDEKTKDFIDRETSKNILGSVVAVGIPALILSVGFTLVFKTPIRFK